MELKRVEVDPRATFYILQGGLEAYRRVAHIGDEPHRSQVITQMLRDLRTAAEAGWFYLNPKTPNQLIAFCDAHRKPFWFVLTPGDKDGFDYIDKDYAVVTVLGHRDSKFKKAIDEHRSLTASAAIEDPNDT